MRSAAFAHDLAYTTSIVVIIRPASSTVSRPALARFCIHIGIMPTHLQRAPHEQRHVGLRRVRPRRRQIGLGDFLAEVHDRVNEFCTAAAALAQSARQVAAVPARYGRDM